MKRSKWLLATCLVCGAKYSVWSEELEAEYSHNLCSKCRKEIREADNRYKDRELIRQP